MREIGGYLELESYEGDEYHKNLWGFNTVRNAIEYVIKERHYRHIYIPHYLCHSVSDMLKKINISFTYYDIDTSFQPILDADLKEEECVLIVNYFGAFKENSITTLVKKYKNIILDNTQCFFQQPVDGVDTVYTCRKFFGVADGAYLATNLPKDKYEELKQDISYTKIMHILGRYETTASEYYSVFKQNDEALSNQQPLKMSKLTTNLMKSIDYEKVRKKRQNNYKYLSDNLRPLNMLGGNDFTGLFMYPLFIECGEKLKQELIKHKVYVPTLWESVYNTVETDSFEYRLVKNLVLIPIDQRYDEQDMKFIYNIINSTFPL